jgi:methyl-accepting chemotaxis protein
MVCTPVAGTPYVVAATTYLDEFHGPVRKMETSAKTLTDEALKFSLMILVVLIYSHRLTGKIKSLTEVTERISVGDLAAEVETTSKDEIGELAEAISRMQESIRLSIERLRRRK